MSSPLLSLPSFNFQDTGLAKLAARSNFFDFFFILVLCLTLCCVHSVVVAVKELEEGVARVGGLRNGVVLSFIGIAAEVALVVEIFLLLILVLFLLLVLLIFLIEASSS